MTQSVRILLLLTAGIIAVAVAVAQRTGHEPAVQQDTPSPDDTRFTIAAAGDTVMTTVVSGADADAGVEAVANLIRGATLAATNLELVLLQDQASASQHPRGWPTGSAREADELAGLGFDLIARANNHAGDAGARGVEETGRILDAANLVHAGAGSSGDDAESARLVSRRGTRVAFIAVSTSVAPEARATRARGDIAGRGGVSTLRYHANITVDPATFESLSQSAPALQPDAKVGTSELRLLGRTIRKGNRTVIEFAAEEEDARAVLGVVSKAASTAEIVVLSLHSHEPRNHSDVPAEFVRQFARAAVEAGADLVIGHGPHQLRGIELHAGGVILHSLGNFLFPYEPVASLDADIFDAGVDLYAWALGAVEPQESRSVAPVEATSWWESVVAIAEFENGEPRGIRLYPLDLGVDLPLERRGTPRLADSARAMEILTRLDALSRPLNTSMTIRDGVGYIEVAGRPQDARP